MTEIGITDPAAAQAASNAATQSAGPGGALGKDEFLQLLVTQLKNQDPMNPMQSQEFAAQLAQFTSVEQLLEIKETLAQGAETNSVLANSINSGVAAGLIGKSVHAAGSTISWNGEHPAEMNFELDSAAVNVTVEIRDDAGMTIRTIDLGGLPAGERTFEWDGMTGIGVAAEKGTYSFEVSAEDADGNTVTAGTFVRGTVDRVTFGQDGIRLWIGSQSVAMSDVETVE